MLIGFMQSLHETLSNKSSTREEQNAHNGGVVVAGWRQVERA
jgi:hypothetical protein